MQDYRKIPMILNLFDGEGGGAAPAGDGGAQGGTQAATGSAQRGKGEYENVVFGNQGNQPEAPGAKVETTSDAQQVRRAQWRQMVEGDYKDLYAEDTQKIINRRFRETKELQSKVDSFQPIIDTLAERYGITDGNMQALSDKINNDTAYWSEAAEEAGMSVEQYKEIQRLRRENKALTDAKNLRKNQDAMNRQLQQWAAEEQALKRQFPAFDLKSEAQDQRFVSMLRSGVPMEHAYKVLHMDEMMRDAMTSAAAATERRITDNVRARGARPVEAGAKAQSGFTIKDDVTKLTRKDRAEIARRVSRGEHISFGSH